jgi:uncharacterized protein (TIGR03083 family)
LSRGLDDDSFEARSGLPEWSRLTIVCHLRYGTHALRRMTLDALSGREASYYPDGRERQRDSTLRPAPGEQPADVLDDWESAAAELDRAWSALDDAHWRTEVIEPSDNRDLGTVTLARLALARLTEVDVHGTDLDIDAPDWSTTLVEVALPTRLAWLTTRRSNHRSSERSLRGSWRLRAVDGLDWLVTVDGDRVESRPATVNDNADGEIDGSRRDLLALLLGRQPLTPLGFSGDVVFAQSFSRAFPGP